MCLNPVMLRSVGYPVPCGKCFECRVMRAREWSFRIALEARSVCDSCMITLTYNDNFLPFDKSVNKRDVQLFLKRLRKQIYPKKIRFFCCGEYGAKRLRPHYHIIIFGYSFADKFFFKNDNKGTPLFRSPLLEKCWSFGFSSIADLVTVEVARYVALYLQKPPVDGRLRPFVIMSNRPGIGFSAIKPDLLLSDKLYLDGKYIKLPRYFLNVLERSGYALEVNFLKARRDVAARQQHQNFLSDSKAYFVDRRNKIKKIEKIFGKTLDKNFMV